MKVRENTKQDSSLTLKEVFSGRVSPELKLTLEIGKIQVTLPRSKDFWTLQDNNEVVRNKKPISVAGRSGDTFTIGCCLVLLSWLSQD